MTKKPVIKIGKRGGKIVADKGDHKEYLREGADGPERSKKEDAEPVSKKDEEKPEPVFVHGYRMAPAWEVVWTSELPEGNKSGCYAKVKDKKGNVIPLYTVEAKEKAALVKWGRNTAMLQDIPEMRPKLIEGMDSSNDMTKQAHEALRLIDVTGMRPGSGKDTKADVKAYGASTMEGRHLTIKGGTATFKFVGKHGVNYEVSTDDPKLVKSLKTRKKAAGDGDKLWPGLNDKSLLKVAKAISPKGRPYKVKDYRTLRASTIAYEAVKGKTVGSEKELKKLKKEVSTLVSKQLNNTPNIALNSYINPMVWEAVVGGES